MQIICRVKVYAPILFGNGSDATSGGKGDLGAFGLHKRETSLGETGHFVAIAIGNDDIQGISFTKVNSAIARCTCDNIVIKIVRDREIYFLSRNVIQPVQSLPSLLVSVLH